MHRSIEVVLKISFVIGLSYILMHINRVFTIGYFQTCMLTESIYIPLESVDAFYCIIKITKRCFFIVFRRDFFSSFWMVLFFPLCNRLYIKTYWVRSSCQIRNDHIFCWRHTKLGCYRILIHWNMRSNYRNGSKRNKSQYRFRSNFIRKMESGYRT